MTPIHHRHRVDTPTILPTTTESRDIRKAPALGFLPDTNIHMSLTLLLLLLGSFPRAHNLSIGDVDIDMVFSLLYLLDQPDCVKRHTSAMILLTVDH